MANLLNILKKYIRIVLLLLLSMKMSCYLFSTTEQVYQILKDIDIYKASIMLLLIIVIYREIKIDDWKAWIYLFVALLSLFAYLKINSISSETFGPDYFKLIVLRGTMYILFIGLLIDLIRHKSWHLVNYIKNLSFVLYLVFVAIFFITNIESAVPYICPFVALFLTKFDDKEKEELIFVFSMGVYYAFAKVFTLSLIRFPYSDDGLRYVGLFSNVGSGCASCACALVICIYYFLLFLKKKEKRGMIISAVFAIYPAMAVMLMASRSVLLGFIFLGLGSWIFYHDRGAKIIGRRLIITAIIGIGSFFALFGISRLLFYLSEIGKVNSSNLNYFWSHVLAMTTANSLEDCIFEPGTVLYSLDALSSTRVSIWFRQLSNVKLTGFNDYSRVKFNSHSFFLANFVRYGIIGGLPFLVWFLSCIVSSAGRLRKNNYALYTFLFFLFMLGTYSAMSLYITSLGGFMLLFSQVLCFGNEEAKALESN